MPSGALSVCLSISCPGCQREEGHIILACCHYNKQTLQGWWLLLANEWFSSDTSSVLISLSSSHYGIGYIYPYSYTVATHSAERMADTGLWYRLTIPIFGLLRICRKQSTCKTRYVKQKWEQRNVVTWCLRWYQYQPIKCIYRALYTTVSCHKVLETTDIQKLSASHAVAMKNSLERGGTRLLGVDSPLLAVPSYRS